MSRSRSRQSVQAALAPAVLLRPDGQWAGRRGSLQRVLMVLPVTVIPTQQGRRTPRAGDGRRPSPRSQPRLLVGVRDHEDIVQADGPPDRPRWAPAHPNARTPRGTCVRAARTAASPEAARVPTKRETVGSEATGPKTAGSARSMPMSARRSPPDATGTRRSGRTFPRSCTAHVLATSPAQRIWRETPP
jgi:hypothetical protein